MVSWIRALVAQLLILAGVAHAQEAAFFRYQESAGLGNLTVRCIAQDARGMLWIGTENGLYRLDGFAIRKEPLPDEAGSEIVEIKTDDRRHIWVATRSGIYAGVAEGPSPAAAGLWHRIAKADHAAVQIDGKQRIDWDPLGALVAMARDNTLWWVDASDASRASTVARPLHVPRFAPSAGTFETDAGPVLADAGALWFGCGRRLCQLLGGRVRTWGPSEGLPEDGWANLLRARDGGIWARSGRLLARLDRKLGRFQAIPAPAYSIWRGEIGLVEDADGRILTSTDAGIARWDGHAWRQWTSRDGLPDTAVRALFFDAAGALWIGCSGRGLYRWVGYGRTEHWTTNSGLPSPVVWSLTRDGAGRVLAATSRGVALLDDDGRRFQPVAPAGELGALVTNLARDDDGVVWWTQGADLMALQPGAQVARAVRRGAEVENVLPGAGGPYLVDRDGVRLLHPGKRGETLPAGLPDAGSLSAVLEDDGVRWFLSARHAWRVEGSRWTPLLGPDGQPLSIENGLASFASRGELWVSDAGGVAVYRLHHDLATLQQRFGRATFADAAAVFLRTDGHGGIWLGTDRGAFTFADGRWHQLDYRSALLWNDVDADAFLGDADGTVWIGTSLGLTRIGATRGWRAAPVLRVDEVSFGDRMTPLPAGAPIPWGERSIRVTIGTPDLDLASSAAVEYRLGDSMPWQRLQGNVIRLDALDAGAYLLAVRASTPAEGAIGPEIGIPFEIDVPWWRSNVAVTMGVLVLACAWWAWTIRLRRRGVFKRRALEAAIAERTAELERSQDALRELGDHNARALEEERTQVSRELHDELGQQLAALRMELSILAVRADDGGRIERADVDELLARTDALVASVRHLVSGLRPPALDGGLPAALQWLASEIRRDDTVVCTVHCDASSAALPGEVAIMVFRIAQESLTNVRKHARARHVAISFARVSSEWELLVQDDGVGFDRAAQVEGYGLLGMEERARALGATLSIESGPTQGTSISLRL
jgi:signal transduction histidine kinase